MTLHPVLLPIPQVEGLKARERIARQREFARLALAQCAAHTGVDPWEWKKDDADVPLPHQGWYWSISHKPMMAAAVIAPAPVGIDVEFIEPRSDGMFDKLASPEEWTLLGKRNWANFFRVWTAKEATLKANGIGVAGFLDATIDRLIDEQHLLIVYRERVWPIEHVFLGEHLAAVTSLNSPIAWHHGKEDGRES